jgi:NADH dehydrogenase
MENVKKNAIPMKTLNDAIEMRNTILKNLEKAAICKDIRERQIIDHCSCWWRTNRSRSFWYVCRNEEEYFPKEYPELGTSASNIYLVDGEMLC